nr:immunoglobulin light chain junction region [Macaca mulatta]
DYYCQVWHRSSCFF